MSKRKPFKEELADFQKEITREIEDHPNWCGEKNCTRLLEGQYRAARLRGVSAEQAQRDYESYHAFG